MAKRTSSTRSARPSRTAANATSRKAPAAAVEIVEDEDGGDIDTGIIIITTVVLLTAFLMIDRLRGLYGEGLF